MANIKFKFDNGNLKRNVRDIPDSINNGINAVMDRAAVSGEAEMKTNAPGPTGPGQLETDYIPNHF